MDLANATDKQFVEHVQSLDRHEPLMELLGEYAGQERGREIVLAEIQKRQLHNIYTSSEKLYASSEQLKVLTWVLIALTFILGILAAPPFVETVKTWLR